MALFQEWSQDHQGGGAGRQRTPGSPWSNCWRCWRFLESLPPCCFRRQGKSATMRGGPNACRTSGNWVQGGCPMPTTTRGDCLRWPGRISRRTRAIPESELMWDCPRRSPAVGCSRPSSPAPPCKPTRRRQRRRVFCGPSASTTTPPIFTPEAPWVRGSSKGSPKSTDHPSSRLRWTGPAIRLVPGMTATHSPSETTRAPGFSR